MKLIDCEQKKYGIYGLPEVLRSKKGPQSHSRIFSGSLYGGVKSEHTNLLKRIGAILNHSNPNNMYFTVDESYSVDMEIYTYADTKVRNYGSSYHLDSVNGKQSGGSVFDVEKRLSRIRKKDDSTVCSEEEEYFHSLPTEKRGLPRLWCELLIAFTQKENALSSVIGRGLEAEFLNRYGLSVEFDQWRDMHGRGFWTSAYLWTYSSE